MRPRLSTFEKTVNFRLTDRLLEGDAGEHFERRGREIKTPARNALFPQYAPSALLWTSVVRSEPLR